MQNICGINSQDKQNGLRVISGLCMTEMTLEALPLKRHAILLAMQLQ